MNKKGYKQLFLVVMPFLLVFIWCAVTSKKQNHPGLYINEILANGNSIFFDSINFENSDWIEIHNSSNKAVNLQNYYLVNCSKCPDKWLFPENTWIQPQGYLVVYANSLDTLLNTNFRLNKEGEYLALCNSDGTLVDSMRYGKQLQNISYGRKEDAGNDWVYFDQPTMGKDNSFTHSVPKPQTSPTIEIITPSGFYDKSIDISIYSPNSGVVYYTLDGSKPTRKSKIYKGPFTLETTAVVKAVFIQNNKLNSPVTTSTFIINDSTHLPVFSISVEQTDFFDPTFGVYSNSITDLRRVANLEYFEDGIRCVNQKVYASIAGNWNSKFEQKPILIEADESLGKTRLEHPFFKDKKIESFISILLRSGGHPDKYATTFRDGFGQQIHKGFFQFDYQAYRPSIVYINGNYWGIYNIRERLNEDFIYHNYGIDKSDFDMLRTAWAKPVNGNNAHFKTLYKYLKNTKTFDFEVIESASQMMDIDNFINYNILEIYVSNIDWPNWNIRYWRKRKNGKWKWILNDFDFALGIGFPADSNMVNYATSPVKTKPTNPPQSTLLLRRLLEIKEFRDQFLQRFAIALNTVFMPERLLNQIDSFQEQLISDMPKHINRWNGYTFKSPWDPGEYRVVSSMEEWNHKIDVLHDFVNHRPFYVQKHLMEKFEIDTAYNLSIDVQAEAVKLNGVRLVKGKYSTTCFGNIPIEGTVEGDDGGFICWEVNGVKLQSKTVKFMPYKDTEIRALFSSK